MISMPPASVILSVTQSILSYLSNLHGHFQTQGLVVLPASFPSYLYPSPWTLGYMGVKVFVCCCSLTHMIYDLKVEFILVTATFAFHRLHHFIPTWTGAPGSFLGMGVASWRCRVVNSWVWSALSLSFFISPLTFGTQTNKQNQSV